MEAAAAETVSSNGHDPYQVVLEVIRKWGEDCYKLRQECRYCLKNIKDMATRETSDQKNCAPDEDVLHRISNILEASRRLYLPLVNSSQEGQEGFTASKKLDAIDQIENAIKDASGMFDGLLCFSDQLLTLFLNKKFVHLQEFKDAYGLLVEEHTTLTQILGELQTFMYKIFSRDGLFKIKFVENCTVDRTKDIQQVFIDSISWLFHELTKLFIVNDKMSNAELNITFKEIKHIKEILEKGTELNMKDSMNEKILQALQSDINLEGIINVETEINRILMKRTELLKETPAFICDVTRMLEESVINENASLEDINALLNNTREKMCGIVERELNIDLISRSDENADEPVLKTQCGNLKNKVKEFENLILLHSNLKQVCLDVVNAIEKSKKRLSKINADLESLEKLQNAIEEMETMRLGLSECQDSLLKHCHQTENLQQNAFKEVKKLNKNKMLCLKSDCEDLEQKMMSRKEVYERLLQVSNQMSELYNQTFNLSTTFMKAETILDSDDSHVVDDEIRKVTAIKEILNGFLGERTQLHSTIIEVINYFRNLPNLEDMSESKLLTDLKDYSMKINRNVEDVKMNISTNVIPKLVGRLQRYFEKIDFHEKLNNNDLQLAFRELDTFNGLINVLQNLTSGVHSEENFKNKMASLYTEVNLMLTVTNNELATVDVNLETQDDIYKAIKEIGNVREGLLLSKQCLEKCNSIIEKLDHSSFDAAPTMKNCVSNLIKTVETQQNIINYRKEMYENLLDFSKQMDFIPDEVNKLSSEIIHSMKFIQTLDLQNIGVEIKKINASKDFLEDFVKKKRNLLSSTSENLNSSKKHVYNTGFPKILMKFNESCEQAIRKVEDINDQIFLDMTPKLIAKLQKHGEKIEINNSMSNQDLELTIDKIEKLKTALDLLQNMTKKEENHDERLKYLEGSISDVTKVFAEKELQIQQLFSLGKAYIEKTDCFLNEMENSMKEWNFNNKSTVPDIVSRILLLEAKIKAIHESEIHIKELRMSKKTSEETKNILFRCRNAKSFIEQQLEQAMECVITLWRLSYCNGKSTLVIIDGKMKTIGNTTNNKDDIENVIKEFTEMNSVINGRHGELSECIKHMETLDHSQAIIKLQKEFAELITTIEERHKITKQCEEICKNLLNFSSTTNHIRSQTDHLSTKITEAVELLGSNSLGSIDDEINKIKEIKEDFAAISEYYKKYFTLEKCIEHCINLFVIDRLLKTKIFLFFKESNKYKSRLQVSLEDLTIWLRNCFSSRANSLLKSWRNKLISIIMTDCITNSELEVGIENMQMFSKIVSEYHGCIISLIQILSVGEYNDEFKNVDYLLKETNKSWTIDVLPRIQTEEKISSIVFTVMQAEIWVKKFNIQTKRTSEEMSQLLVEMMNIDEEIVSQEILISTMNTYQGSNEITTISEKCFEVKHQIKQCIVAFQSVIQISKSIDNLLSMVQNTSICVQTGDAADGVRKGYERLDALFREVRSFDIMFLVYTNNLDEISSFTTKNQPQIENKSLYLLPNIQVLQKLLADQKAEYDIFQQELIKAIEIYQRKALFSAVPVSFSDEYQSKRLRDFGTSTKHILVKLQEAITSMEEIRLLTINNQLSDRLLTDPLNKYITFLTQYIEYLSKWPGNLQVAIDEIVSELVKCSDFSDPMMNSADISVEQEAVSRNENSRDKKSDSLECETSTITQERIREPQVIIDTSTNHDINSPISVSEGISNAIDEKNKFDASKMTLVETRNAKDVNSIRPVRVAVRRGRARGGRKNVFTKTYSQKTVTQHQGNNCSTQDSIRRVCATRGIFENTEYEEDRNTFTENGKDSSGNDFETTNKVQPLETNLKLKEQIVDSSADPTADYPELDQNHTKQDISTSIDCLTDKNNMLIPVEVCTPQKISTGTQNRPTHDGAYTQIPPENVHNPSFTSEHGNNVVLTSPRKDNDPFNDPFIKLSQPKILVQFGKDISICNQDSNNEVRSNGKLFSHSINSASCSSNQLINEHSLTPSVLHNDVYNGTQIQGNNHDTYTFLSTQPDLNSISRIYPSEQIVSLLFPKSNSDSNSEDIQMLYCNAITWVSERIRCLSYLDVDTSFSRGRAAHIFVETTTALLLEIKNRILASVDLIYAIAENSERELETKINKVWPNFLEQTSNICCKIYEQLYCYSNNSESVWQKIGCIGKTFSQDISGFLASTEEEETQLIEQLKNHLKEIKNQRSQLYVVTDDLAETFISSSDIFPMNGPLHNQFKTYQEKTELFYHRINSSMESGLSVIFSKCFKRVKAAFAKIDVNDELSNEESVKSLNCLEVLIEDISKVEDCTMELFQALLFEEDLTLSRNKNEGNPMYQLQAFRQSVFSVINRIKETLTRRSEICARLKTWLTDTTMVIESSCSEKLNSKIDLLLTIDKMKQISEQFKSEDSIITINEIKLLGDESSDVIEQFTLTQNRVEYHIKDLQAIVQSMQSFEESYLEIKICINDAEHQIHSSYANINTKNSLEDSMAEIEKIVTSLPTFDEKIKKSHDLLEIIRDDSIFQGKDLLRKQIRDLDSVLTAFRITASRLLSSENAILESCKRLDSLFFQIEDLRHEFEVSQTLPQNEGQEIAILRILKVQLKSLESLRSHYKCEKVRMMEALITDPGIFEAMSYNKLQGAFCDYHADINNCMGVLRMRIHKSLDQICVNLIQDISKQLEKIDRNQINNNKDINKNLACIEEMALRIDIFTQEISSLPQEIIKNINEALIKIKTTHLEIKQVKTELKNTLEMMQLKSHHLNDWLCSIEENISKHDAPTSHAEFSQLMKNLSEMKQEIDDHNPIVTELRQFYALDSENMHQILTRYNVCKLFSTASLDKDWETTPLPIDEKSGQTVKQDQSTSISDFKTCSTNRDNYHDSQFYKANLKSPVKYENDEGVRQHKSHKHGNRKKKSISKTENANWRRENQIDFFSTEESDISSQKVDEDDLDEELSVAMESFCTISAAGSSSESLRKKRQTCSEKKSVFHGVIRVTSAKASSISTIKDENLIKDKWSEKGKTILQERKFKWNVPKSKKSNIEELIPGKRSFAADNSTRDCAEKNKKRDFCKTMRDHLNSFDEEIRSCIDKTTELKKKMESVFPRKPEDPE